MTSLVYNKYFWTDFASTLSRIKPVAKNNFALGLTFNLEKLEYVLRQYFSLLHLKCFIVVSALNKCKPNDSSVHKNIRRALWRMVRVWSEHIIDK